MECRSTHTKNAALRAGGSANCAFSPNEAAYVSLACRNTLEIVHLVNVNVPTADVSADINCRNAFLACHKLHYSQQRTLRTSSCSTVLIFLER